MSSNPSTSLFIAQAVAEYGMLQALVAGFTAARYRVEMYLGEGNSKYLLLGMLAVLILLLVRRRR